MTRDIDELKNEIAATRIVTERILKDRLARIPWNYKQWAFMTSKKRFVMLKGPNQIGGKTTSLHAPLVWHLKGQYPDDWDGLRFDHPPKFAVGAPTVELTQQVHVDRIFGPPYERGGGYGDDMAYISRDYFDPEKDVYLGLGQGKGSIASVYVDWHDPSGKKAGKSVLYMFSYKQGWQGLRSKTLDGVWMSEESPIEVLNEMLARLLKTRGILRMESCPQLGRSKVLEKFAQLGDLFELIPYNVEDCDHLTEEHKQEAIRTFKDDPESMFRIWGNPLEAEGHIFSHVLDENLKKEPHGIPGDWPEIIGLDLPHTSGKLAIARLAFDPSTGKHDQMMPIKTTITRAFKGRINSFADRVEWIKRMGGEEIPVAWPHDGGRDEPGTEGESIASRLRDSGINMLDEHAHYELESGIKSNRTATVLEELADLMNQGMFQVFYNAAPEFLTEKANYRVKDGKKVKGVESDLMDAVIKGYMMRRFAKSRNQIREGEEASPVPAEDYFNREFFEF